MSLIVCRDLQLAYGGPPLLDGVELVLEPTQRVCLVGRNGTGKSTLLALLAGRRTPDGGHIQVADGARIAELPQAVPADLAGPVREVVAGGLGELAEALAAHRRLVEAGAEADLAALDRVTRRIEAAGGWDFEGRIERVVTRLDLPRETPFETLSGGLQRRVLLGRALVTEPDLLILDEPTNHLDIEAIEWLEGVLRSWRGAVLFTSHDRRFIERVATRILELDRGQLYDHPGDWAGFLARREARLETEARAADEFDRALAREEAWIRQGIKARRTRNEGRVRRLESLRRQRRERRERQGTARLEVGTAERSGRRVIEAEDVTFAWDPDHRPVLAGLSTLIERGDRIGLIGPNGSGKTTLLRLLLGELTPQRGRIRHGTRLEVAYFDQHRAELDPDARVVDAVADGDEYVEIGGPEGRQRRHVIGYLQDFLFPPEQARGSVGGLSGGERARLLLARLFARPSNLLVMDEPTNDLDIETLELLEERLLEYPGTLLLVSHDREFIDRVVTGTLVMEGDGRVGEYVGGYDDWLRQRPAPESARASTPPAAPEAEPRRSGRGGSGPPERRRKLGFREQQELAALPGRIEALEADIEACQVRLADPELYRADDGARVAELRQQLETLERQLEVAFERWAALEDA